jgi:hypothetical protein
MIEVNPLMKYLIDHNIFVFIILKVTLVSAASLYLWKKRDLLLAKVGIIVCFLTYLCLILHFLISII